MEIGIKEAKNNLSKLVDAVMEGEEVFLTNRGARMIQLVPAPKAADPSRGRGAWKDKAVLYAGWDSREEDLRIQGLFEAASAAGAK